jgi:hypothetical protein
MQAELESSCAIIKQGKIEVKCDDGCTKHNPFIQPSALPMSHASSTLRALNSRRKANRYPLTKVSHGNAQHPPRVNAEGVSLLRHILGVFHPAFKKPNANVMHRVRAHLTRSRRQERPVREGGNFQLGLSRVHSHIRHPVFFVL